jgi:hypothetical protein
VVGFQTSALVDSCSQNFLAGPFLVYYLRSAFMVERFYFFSRMLFIENIPRLF